MTIWNGVVPSGWTAHGLCPTSASELVALHAASDAAVGLAFVSIAVALVVFSGRATELRRRWLVWLVAAFMVAGGATHLLSILAPWPPLYAIQGLTKLLTAVLAIVVAILLWRLAPRMMAAPSASELHRLNEKLAAAGEERAAATAQLRAREAEVHRANAELARTVEAHAAELRLANERLAEATQAAADVEAEFRTSFENAAVGKVQADAETGRLIRVNRAFAAMLGYAPEDLIGRLGQELSPPEDSEADAATYAELRSAGPRVFVREKRYLRRDGSTVWGRLSATIVRNRGQGRPDLLIGVIENIEEQHRAREALRITTADLERTIEERTAALAQRDLLLREVYHRVKNNLQMVDALLLMQARDVADPEAKTALRGLRSRIFALGLVHHQLMGSSNLQTFDVAPFLQELSANLADGAGARGIEMRVHADPLQVGLDFAIPLGLLVTELLTNAIKHAFPDGIGEIDVSLSLADDDWIDLVVADNGKGFKPQAAGDETGLGGRIMRGLLGQMRGTMTVGNGRGARCEIRLPAPEVR